MSNAQIGALRVTLGMDSAAFTSGLSQAQKQLTDASARLKSVGQRMQGIGVGLSVAVTAPLVAFGKGAIDAANDMNTAMAQVDATLAATGNAVGRTSDQLKAMAGQLQRVSTYDDDEILKGVTSNLLRFGQVQGQVFDRAQQVIIDYAAKTGQSLESASTTIGKALNSPIRGLTQLRRAGIELGADQEALVRQMMAVGDVAGAQKVILDALNGTYAGSAQAARDAAPGSDLIDAWRDLQETVGMMLVKVIGPMTDALARMLERFNALSPGVKKMAVIFAAVAAAAGPLLVIVGTLVTAFAAILPVLGTVGAALAALPLAPVLLAVGAVTAAFVLWGDDIIPVLRAFGRQVADVLGPKIMPLFDAVKGAVSALGEVIGAIFSGSGGSASADFTQWGQIVANVIGAAVELITGAINVITNILKALGALLRGDFSAMWGHLGSAVMSVVRAIGGAFETLFPGVIDSVSRMVTGVRDWLVTRFQQMVVGPIKEKIEAVSGFFRDLYVAVVGNSWIPDMVTEIGDWIAKLDDEMVSPVEAATSQAGAAFEGLGDQVAGVFKSIASKDWKGALGGLFNILGGQGGRLGNLGNLGKSLMKFLPGFASGGSFNVAGSGTTDSKVVAFRATPGERVDISTRGQQRSQKPAGFVVRVDKSPLFNAYVTQVAQPLAAQAYHSAVQTSSKLAPGLAARAQRDIHRLGTVR